MQGPSRTAQRAHSSPCLGAAKHVPRPADFGAYRRGAGFDVGTRLPRAARGAKLGLRKRAQRTQRFWAGRVESGVVLKPRYAPRYQVRAVAITSSVAE